MQITRVIVLESVNTLLCSWGISWNSFTFEGTKYSANKRAYKIHKTLPQLCHGIENLKRNLTFLTMT